MPYFIMQRAVQCIPVCIFVRWQFKLSLCIPAQADDTGNWGHQTWGESDKRLVMCVALSIRVPQY